MKTVICKAPMRITLGGGSTDLPFYATKYGGFVVTTAIDKYVYVLVKDRFEKEIRFSYSQTEIVNEPNQIQHPIVRAVLKHYPYDYKEIATVSDMPSNSGLGSSGAFTVALVTALNENCNRKPNSIEENANHAYILEREAGEECGCQDHYISALGKTQCLMIDGKVKHEEIKLSKSVLNELQQSLVFFWIGGERRSTEILSSQRKNANIESMDLIKDVGYRVYDALKSGNLQKLGELQLAHWNAKKCTSSLISTERVNGLIQFGIKRGATGGKLLGAGGSGFIMFVCPSESVKAKLLGAFSLREVEFKMNVEGRTVKVLE